jgi:hypothetical protein
MNMKIENEVIGFILFYSCSPLHYCLFTLPMDYIIFCGIWPSLRLANAVNMAIKTSNHTTSIHGLAHESKSMKGRICTI